jgi:molybdenum cofactor biosynthesis enzyme MoaA
VTWRCNYRCTFCDLPDRARGDPPLATLVERLELLKRRGALAVGLTGGGPLLHPRSSRSSRPRAASASWPT